jgi:uncharacterized protein (DUF1697 family)
MASTQVALLRGVNVGRGNRIAMADLRALLVELGYTDVRTLLNSGNAIFSGRLRPPKDTAERIQKALSAKHGLTARVMVLDAEELGLVIRENPLLAVATNPSRMLVAVLADPSDRVKLLALARQDWGADALGIGSRAAYLWCSEGVLKSELNAAVNKSLGDAVTSRNWATMLKLGTMAGAG